LYPHRLVLLTALGLLCVGCSAGTQGAGSSASSSGDAARCTSDVCRIGLNLQTYESDHFLVLSSADSGDAAATGRFLDGVQRTFYESFSQAGFSLTSPQGRLVCVCLTSYDELDAYGRQADGADASWMDGYYSYRTNRIAIVQRGRGPARRTHAAAAPLVSARPAVYGTPVSGVPGEGLNLRTTTHEMAHLLAFNSGLQRRDATYPFWVTEGLATNFEAGDGGACGLGPKQCCHNPRLVSAKASGRMISLDRFTGITDVGGGGQSTTDAYAQAWGLFHFLLQRHPQQLRQYMAALKQGGRSDGQSLRCTFEATFGPTDAVERDFRQYIDQLARGSAM